MVSISGHQRESVLLQPVTCLKGVGPAVAEKLVRLNIISVGDLLFHLPLRYEDKTRLWPMSTLVPGQSALIEGEVVKTTIQTTRSRVLVSTLREQDDEVTLRFFRFSRFHQQRLTPGVRIRCYGEVQHYGGGLQMVHPETQLVKGRAAELDTHLTPVYPLVDGLGQSTIRKMVDQALAMLLIEKEQTAMYLELLPKKLLDQFAMPTLASALRFIHKPDLDASLVQINATRHPSQQRIIYEELLAHHLSLRELKLRIERNQAPELNAKPRLRLQLESGLPFSPTSAQRRVTAEIAADMQKSHPMQRLLQGDVGSGKTLVATMALLQAVESDYQAALMVPTELLAEQHFHNIRACCETLGVRVLMLGASMKAADKTEVRRQMSLGEVDIIVGTHALFQNEVCFKRLGLIVVDEQHRFGVHQRMALREKGVAEGMTPHQLIMTATPIPRTLAMTAYADLDLSTIDELPPGRQAIDTVVIADTRRDAVVARIREACATGRQAYWVCSLVEESEALQCQAAEDTAISLAEMIPEINVGLVHGRQKSQKKEEVMTAFRRGEINLLVATTVIEVGVDVPNASLMVIENAERFGLAQLHQLRGRVGRGDVKSACVMLYKGPLSRLARSRLEIMRESTDGFEIAQRDLELRGPGDVLGARQSGLAQLKIADLTRDQDLFPAVEQGAQIVLDEYAAVVPLLVQRWLKGGEQYGQV